MKLKRFWRVGVLLACYMALLFYVLTVSPSLTHYWTIFVFFGITFVCVALTLWLVMQKLGRLHAQQKLLATLVASVGCVYILALSTLAQLRVADVVLTGLVVSATVWFLGRSR